MTTKDVEKKAMKLVMEYEKKNGRKSKDVSLDKDHGYDLYSRDSKEERFIEVKGMSHKKGDFISLYKKLLTRLGTKISNYYIYVVFDIKNIPKLKIIPPEIILSNLEIETSFFIKAKSYKDIEAIEL